MTKNQTTEPMKETVEESSLPEIDTLQQQLNQMENNWKRALADYQNLVRRTQQQQQLLSQLACITLIERVLPVLDHLKLASQHLKDAGLDMIVKQLNEALAAENVEEIIAANQSFDPVTMEATEQINGEKNKVIEIVTAGYRIGDRIIRPAKVKVGNGQK